MDLLVIKLIGIVMLFHAGNAPADRAFYTVYAADGKGGIKMCGVPVESHEAYLRVIGTAKVTGWTTAIPCKAERQESQASPCSLYPLDHDELFISDGISDSNIGVDPMPSLAMVPRLKKFGGDEPLTPAHAQGDSAVTLPLALGTIEGVDEDNDTRTMRLTVPQPQIQVKEVTITSKTRPGYTVVVPAGAHIAIINLPTKFAQDRPGDVTGSGHEAHWFLHYKILDVDPPKAQCTFPPSATFLLEPEFRRKHKHKLSLVVLNKACSPTTYP
jgi:hypothetical protein